MLNKNRTFLVLLAIALTCGMLFMAQTVAIGQTYIQFKPLTCKYVDSLSLNNDTRSFVNKGVTIDIQPQGQYRELYKAVCDVHKKYGYKSLGDPEEACQQLFAWRFDLNGDGNDEAIVFPAGGNVGGAKGHGDILIFRSITSTKKTRWDLIGVLFRS